MKCHPEVLSLFQLVDELMGKLARQSAFFQKPVTCAGLGCYHCCVEPVYADWLEIDHAMGRIPPDVRKRIKARTVEWVKKVEASGMLKNPRPDVIEWRKIRAWCPCLENGKCMIYQDRPASCRSHCACGPIEGCIDDEKRKKQQFLTSPEIDNAVAMAMLQAGTFTRQDNMGVWLAEILLGLKVESNVRKEWRWDKQEKTWKVTRDGAQKL